MPADAERPAKEIYASPGALILQQMHDLTDEEAEICKEDSARFKIPRIL